MKAYLEIEAIGDDADQWLRLWRNAVNELAPGLGTATFGGPIVTRWVARIIGTDPVYKYAREFLRFKKDYSRANSKGSRGVYKCYLLESGNLYEVKGYKGRRYFCTVSEDGEIEVVNAEFVNQWVKEHSELTCSMLPDNE